MTNPKNSESSGEEDSNDIDRSVDNGDNDLEDDDEEDDDDEEEGLFPTHAAFTVPIEIKPTPRLGPGQFGVFAAEDIPAHTEFWVWTHRVVEIPSSEIEAHIAKHYSCTAPDGTLVEDTEAIRSFLRRGFCLPAPHDGSFYSNPTDAGTFMNHSSRPNCARPHGTSRLIRAGEELTMDYSGNGNPDWYADLCHKHGILTAVEIAATESERGGVVEPAFFRPGNQT